MTKVLVIEDEELLRESIVDILKTGGFTAVSAENGRKGLDLASEFVPELILCDVRMPELDGYEVLKALRQDPVLENILLIFLTAETQQTVQRQGQILGANAYLIKPFTKAQLLEVINQVIRDR
ncbi:MAG TPA: response regulator [Candidatus Sericytochromatia bacterium]